MRYPLVEVEWVDSAFNPGWHRVEFNEVGISTCRTTGYLISRTRQQVIVAMNVSEQSYGEAMAIPRSCVKAINRLAILMPIHRPSPRNAEEMRD